MEERSGSSADELGKLADDQLRRLCDESTRSAFLSKLPPALHAGIIEKLADLVRREVRVDLQAALELAEAAIEIAKGVDDDGSVALAVRAKANVLWVRGDCRGAVELFRRAAELFGRSGNLNEVARTLSSSIQSLILLGEYDASFAAADSAREIFTSLGDTWRIARLEINVANIYHRQGRFAEALASYERAYRQLLPHNDIEAIGASLHNIAVCRIAVDDFRGALEAYQRVREFWVGHDMPLLVAQADYNIAYLFYLRGDYSRALELLNGARENCRRTGDRYHLGLCDLDQSEIYLELNLVDEAAEMAQRSFEQFTELNMPFDAGRSLANQAVAAGLKGDATQSLELFARAKDIFLRENNQVWPSMLNLYQASILFNQGDMPEARRLTESARLFFERTKLPSKETICELMHARIWLKEQNLISARLHCENALRLINKHEARILSYQAYFLMGQLEEASGNPVAAYDAYQMARSGLETLRSGIHGDELKIGFMKNKVNVYERLVHLCLHTASAASSFSEAFLYVEEAKSRALRDLVFDRGHSLSVSRQEENAAHRQARELREELNWSYHRLEKEQLSQAGPSQEVLQSLESRVRAQERQLLQLLRESPTQEPFRTPGAADTISLEQIRESLDGHTALLEYFAIGDQLFVAVVTDKSLTVCPLAALSHVTERMRMLQFQLTKCHLGREYIARFEQALLQATQTHLHELYRDVFEPLGSLRNISHLVVVPHGPLHSLAFHALFDGQAYLIDRFTISYSPSASVHALCHRKSQTGSGTSLLLGISDTRTPFVHNEISAVGAVVPDAKILLNSDATQNALKEYGSRSEMIHIATHGYFRRDSPLFSAIRLGDSYLNMHDLYEMSLPCELLTLSACVTGLSVVEEGDELLGLLRALLQAGARSVLLSLWDVDDQSTAKFMKEFYSRLVSDRASRAVAFQDAIRQVRTQYAHPYYWAAFKLIGRTSSMNLGNKFSEDVVFSRTASCPFEVRNDIC